MKNFLLSLVSLLVFSFSNAQIGKDSSVVIKEWSLGGVPVVAYNADFGLQYGAIANLYYYGDQGIRYPYYDHSIYLELTNTTRNDRRVVLRYDARELVKNGRFRAELAQRLTHFRPFYGFNGYESVYDKNLSDPSSDSFLTQLYYAYEQNRINALANWEKNVFNHGKKFRAQIEVQATYMGVDAPNLELFNKGKSFENTAPDTVTLYDQYVTWGVIPDNERNGGTYFQFAFGGVIDTRDIEPHPSKGVFEEFSLNYGLPLSQGQSHVVALRLVHRHYLTLILDRLIFAHRLQYRSFLTDDVPFYILQTMGGSDDIRGIRFARLMGEGVFGGNAELRWKVFKMVIFGQNIYGALSGFFDTGIVTKSYDFSREGIPFSSQILLQKDEEVFHHGAGFGIRGALNENFIVAVDYGMALDERDGDEGLYITLGWLF